MSQKWLTELRTELWVNVFFVWLGHFTWMIPEPSTHSTQLLIHLLWEVLITISQSPKWHLQIAHFIQPTVQFKPKDSSLTIVNDKEKQQNPHIWEDGTSKCLTINRLLVIQETDNWSWYIFTGTIFTSSQSQVENNQWWNATSYDLLKYCTYVQFGCTSSS